MDGSGICLFALNASRRYGQAIAEHLGIALCEHEEREFEDGEHKSRPLVNVRGKDVFVVQSLYGEPQQSANDKLCRLLFFIGALKDASAARVTAVVPYLAYARKDRKTQPRDPVTTRYVAAVFEAVGVDRVLTLDVHNLAAYQNAFRCRTDHLEGYGLFVDYFAARLGRAPVTVISPDLGGVKRAEQFRRALIGKTGRDAGMAFVEKYRARGEVSGEAIVGDVAGSEAIIFDDLISSGTTIARAANACRELGAVAVHAAATHGLFAGEANHNLASAPLTTIAVTDTITPFRLEPKLAQARLVLVPAAGLFAEAIRRIHDGGSLVALMAD